MTARTKAERLAAKLMALQIARSMPLSWRRKNRRLMKTLGA